MNRMLLIAVLFTNISLLMASSEESSIRQNVATGLHQIRLPDGKSLFGDATAVMGTGSFDLVHLDDDTRSAFSTFSDLITILRHPVKTKGWIRTEYYTPKEIIDYFIQITESASHLNMSALQVIWHFLRDGDIHGVHLPDLTPQPERAALFKELFDWRAGQIPDANHALEVIHTERERLDAIAAEADEKAARILAQAAAKTIQEASTLRRRRLPSDNNNSSELDRLLKTTPHSPLVTAN